MATSGAATSGGTGAEGRSFPFVIKGYHGGPHRLVVVRVACTLAAAASACAPDTRVAAGAPPAAINADSLRSISAIEEARIGSDADPEAGFSNVTAVAVDAEGNAYVFDRGTRNIRVFDARGGLARTIGGPGSGPGEFSAYPHELGVRGDTVWAFDRSGARLHVFRRDGTLIGSHPVAPRTEQLHDGFTGLTGPLALRGDGYLISHLSLATGRNMAAPVPPSDTARVPRVRYTLAGVVVDTIGHEIVPPLGPVYVPDRNRRVPAGGAQFTVPFPPHDGPLHVSFPDGNIRVDAHRASSAGAAFFAVTRFALDGSIAHQLTFRYAPNRYEGAVLDTIAMRPVARSPRGSDAAFRAVRAALEFPEFQAPVYRAFAGADSTVWLRREDNAGGVHRWIVIEWNGDVRGVVLLARSASPMWAAGAVLWAIDTDAAGVPWLVRYRVGS